MKKSRHIESKATWWLWCGMFVFLVIWGLSGCPSPKPGLETQEEPGLEQGKEVKKEPVSPDATEPGKEPDGKEALSDAKDAADTPEPVSEPTPEPEPTDNSDGGPDVFGDGGSEGRFENIPEEPTTEFVPKDDICGGRRPCVTTYAGQPWDKEGPALADWFNFPTTVASDGKNTIYVWDYNKSKIFTYDTVTKRVKLFAGNGTFGEKDGPALQVPLQYVCGMAISPKGELYFAALDKIRKIDSKGNVLTLKGGFAGTCGVAFDSQGTLYVADKANIYTYDEVTSKLSVFAGSGTLGYKNGPKLQAQFYFPKNMVFDSKGVLYVSEKSNEVIRKVDTNGMVSLLYGNDPTPGKGSDETGMAIDQGGNIYIASRKMDSILKISPNGTQTTVAGGFNGYTDGPFATAQFWQPAGIAFDANGKLYVADEGNERLRMLDFSTKMVSTVAGDVPKFIKDGPADWAVFGELRSITLTPNGDLYIADYDANDVRKVDTNRVVSSLKCEWYRTIVSDPKGELYISGGYGVHKLSLSPNCSIKLMYGKATPGHLDGPISQATFTETYGFFFDSKQNIYVADKDRVRFINVSQGTVSTLGKSPYPKSYFQGIASDSKGNVYVADAELAYIGKFTPNGVFSIFAGSPGNRGYIDDVGQKARFQFPRDLAIDTRDYIYVIDNAENSIRRIDPQGKVTTFAGKRQSGFANGWGTQALFLDPNNIVFDGSNALYVSDGTIGKVRKILLR